ncbi:MAG: PaaI family thioesterase [Steroidobacteraceae bacterium]
MLDLDALNERSVGKFPGFLGVVFTYLDGPEIGAELCIRDEFMAPNGFLHAGTIVTLADTCCGYGCFANLPQGATGFTTIELKSNHLGTARQGTLASLARAVHRGRTTQVWDALVTHKETNKTLALFRCTQMILYAK